MEATLHMYSVYFYVHVFRRCVRCGAADYAKRFAFL